MTEQRTQTRFNSIVGKTGLVADVESDRLKVSTIIEGGSARPVKAKLYEFTGSQTNATILTPTTGKRIDLYFCSLTSDDSSGAKVVVRFNTSNQNVFIDWTKTAASPAQLVNFQGNVNEVLSLTVTGLPGNKNGVIYIGYAEID